MTSSINPNNINGQYPIAGQDNDSQGFRDNFTNVKNNLTFAKAEIEDLQNKAILKSALSGGSLSNDLALAQLIRAQLLKATETKNDLGTQTGSLSVSWGDGHFQYFTTSGNVTLGFSGWDSTTTGGQYAKMRLQVTTDASARTITFPASVTTGLADIQGATGANLVLPASGTYLFELSTHNNGTDVTIQDLLRNYDIVTTGSSGSFTSLNVSGNVLASGAVLSSATINGNLVHTGGKVESGYQIYKPTANVSIQANVNVSRVIVAPTPSGGITSFWTDVILPNVAVDGKTITISSNVAVETFRVLSPWVGYTVDTGANVALASNTPATFVFHSADNKWFKV